MLFVPLAFGLRICVLPTEQIAAITTVGIYELVDEIMKAFQLTSALILQRDVSKRHIGARKSKLGVQMVVLFDRGKCGQPS